MRYFYSVCLVVISMGFPLLAKTNAPLEPTPSYSSKDGIKTAALPNVSSTAQTNKQSPKHTRVVASTVPQGERPLGSPILGNRLVAFPAPPAPKPHIPVTTYMADDAGRTTSGGRLARVTAYWAGEGDYYTGKCISATGVRLHDGHCAVDPSIIPYGSIVEIAGVGKYLAVDTGSAVISRTAAREAGHNSAERNALVVDVFFEDAREGERFAAGSAKFVSISWWTPHSADAVARARSLFAEEDWTKIQSKQL